MIRKLTNAEIEQFGREPISFRNGRGPVLPPPLEDPYETELLCRQFKRNANGLIVPVRYDEEV
jgi:hypothetical protein